jgi:hypothetical protein
MEKTPQQELEDLQAEPSIPKGHGRPQKKIDWELVKKLAAQFNPPKDIAYYLDVWETDLNVWCKRDNGVTLGDFVEKWQGTGRILLRGAQFQAAMKGTKGNVQMQRWLGVNYCGQSNNVKILHKVESQATQEPDGFEIVEKLEDGTEVLIDVPDATEGKPEA